jgi:hypothetical protein
MFCTQTGTTRRSFLRATFSLLTVAAIASASILRSEAHHANSAYDRERTVSVTGTVTRWQFINPHCGIWLDVEQDDGSIAEWAGEFQSVQDLYRYFGWNKDTFQPGDEVTIIGNPDRREGQTSMWVSEVVFSDGTRTEVRSTP